MLSIIIPTLNEEKVLEKKLLSLKELTAFPYEVIISDGRSTDRTIEIAKKYNCKIIEYTGTVRQTIAMARNMGAEKAAGEYLVFIDADVLIPNINDFFTKALNIFDKNKSLAGLAPFIDYMPAEATFADKFFGGIMNTRYRISNNFFHIGEAAGEFQMIRRDVFYKIGGYNENLTAGEDIDLFYRLSTIGRTRVDKSLHVFQSTRRVHATGWPKLLWQWFINFLYNKLFKKSFDKEWKVIR